MKKVITEEHKDSANNFFKSIKSNPKEIILWCEREIKAYEELIKLIKGKI